MAPNTPPAKAVEVMRSYSDTTAIQRRTFSRQHKQKQLDLNHKRPASCSPKTTMTEVDIPPPASPCQSKQKHERIPATNDDKPEQTEQQPPPQQQKQEETPEVVEAVVPSTALPGRIFALQLNINNTRPTQEIQVRCPFGAQPGDHVIVVVQQSTSTPSSLLSTTEINNLPHRALLISDTTLTTTSSAKLAQLGQRQIGQNSIDNTLADDLKQSTAFVIMRPTIVPYERYRHLMVGALVCVTSNEPVRSFSYYKLRISHIQRVFKDVYIPWNAKYPAAQRIYGPGPTAVLLRQAIRVEKQGLYGRGMAAAVRGDLCCARDLLMLFDMGLRRGRSTMFTYVIDDDSFRCSETGLSFSKDYMSKHAVHAGAEPRIRFAGEFFFAWADEPEEEVVDINNNISSNDNNDKNEYNTVDNSSTNIDNNSCNDINNINSSNDDNINGRSNSCEKSNCNENSSNGSEDSENGNKNNDKIKSSEIKNKPNNINNNNDDNNKNNTNDNNSDSYNHDNTNNGIINNSKKDNNSNNFSDNSSNDNKKHDDNNNSNSDDKKLDNDNGNIINNNVTKDSNNNPRNTTNNLPRSKCIPCLVIDNNSGTFAPDRKYLPLLRELMQSNFPDLDVKALDRESPELQMLKERMFGSSSSKVVNTIDQMPACRSSTAALSAAGGSALTAAAAAATTVVGCVRVKASSVTKGFSWASGGLRLGSSGGSVASAASATF